MQKKKFEFIMQLAGVSLRSAPLLSRTRKRFAHQWMGVLSKTLGSSPRLWGPLLNFGVACACSTFSVGMVATRMHVYYFYYVLTWFRRW